MSDSNLTSILFAVESVFNEVPDLASTLDEIPFTGDTLVPEKGTIESATIRSDRAVDEIIKVSESSTGGINAELIASDYSPLFEAQFCGTYATSTDSHTGTWNSAGDTFTLDSGTFTAAFQAAKLIKVALAATAAHDGVHRVVSITSTVITFKAGTVTASDASDAVDLTYNYVQNGNTERSYLIEKQYTSTASDYFLAFSGCVFNEFVLTAEPESAITVAFNQMGGRISSGGATFGDGSPTSFSANPIITSSSGIEEILIAGTAQLCANRFEVTHSNGLRKQPVLSSEFPKSYGLSRYTVNGQIDLFFDNSTELDIFLAHTAQSMQLVLADTSGNKFSFFYPSVQYTTGNAPTDAVDSDIISPMAFSAQHGGTATPYAAQLDFVTA
jgi:hypothetical protein